MFEYTVHVYVNIVFYMEAGYLAITCTVYEFIDAVMFTFSLCLTPTVSSY